MSGLVFRPITGPEELELFCRVPYILNDELAGDLAEGRRRPEHLWIAVDDRGDVHARLAWWGGERPEYLDILDIAVGGPSTGYELLSAAMDEVVRAGVTPPEYLRFASADWRGDPVERGQVEDAMSAVGLAGYELLAERLRLEWRPGTPIPEPAGRLVFRPVEGRDEMIRLMTRVTEGSLDAHTRDDLTTMSPSESATAHYDGELAKYRSPQSWWRVATRPDGEPVGFVTPAHNAYNPVIGYIAVLPGHRGQGYIADILAEGTRILAAEGVPRIRAATDLGNRPMARAFAAAGWVVYGRAITMRWGPKVG